MRFERFVLVALLLPAANSSRAQLAAQKPVDAKASTQSSTGAVTTTGYEKVGNIRGDLIVLEVRQTQSNTGLLVQGLLVRVSPTSSQTTGAAFVDFDELDGLLRGVDTLLAIDKNPTKLARFQSRFETKDGLVVTAYDEDQKHIAYRVSEGNVTTSSAGNLFRSDIEKLRNGLVEAKSRLATLR